MQPGMSCSCLCVPALCGAVLAGAVLAQSAREGDIASLGVSGPQAGLAAVASVWLPLCSLCFPEAESDDIIKSFILSRAKSSAQPQVALSSHCNLISGVSQKQSSSPRHSSSHSPSKDPSILGVPGVLLVSLPTCCAGNRLGPVSPHCDQAPGTKPRSLLLPTRFRITARTDHATAWNGMNPTSLLPLWCPAEQNNPFGLVLKPAHPAGSFAFPDDFVGGIVTRLPSPPSL